MDADTSLGGRRVAFPTTPGSAVYRIRTDDPVARGRAFQSLVRAYWKPVYKHIRLRWRKSNEDSKDLTQSFFTHCFEKQVFETYNPELALFRTFVRKCVDNHVSHKVEAAKRIKRGGDKVLLSLDYDEAELEIQTMSTSDLSPEEVFEREWARNLYTMSVDTLRENLAARGREMCFEVFRIYDLGIGEKDAPTYQAVAADLETSVTNVTNYLASARRQFRSIVIENLKELTANEEEFDDAVRQVLGVDSVHGK